MRDERRLRRTLRRLEALPLARRAPLASLNTKCITHLLENPAGDHTAFGKGLKSFIGSPANDNVISLNRTFRVNVQNSIISDEGIETSRTKQLTLDVGTTIEVANSKQRRRRRRKRRSSRRSRKRMSRRRRRRRKRIRGRAKQTSRISSYYGFMGTRSQEKPPTAYPPFCNIFLPFLIVPLVFPCGVLPNTKHIIMVVNLTSDDNGRVVGGSLKLRCLVPVSLRKIMISGNLVQIARHFQDRYPELSPFQLSFNNQDRLTFRGNHIVESTMEKD
ncbi:hypothetical protein V1478_005956 [Vespula squamosa]|uniref:Uncharacterized protein n=1 Tax=Vespula squamosa TaxID=30214 RepID=A0ABD2B8Z3_VESSQ